LIEAYQKKALFQISLAEQHYTDESLCDMANFAKLDGLLYSKISYLEAQNFCAWKIIFDHHKEFEPLFVEDYKEYLIKNKFESSIRISGENEMRLMEKWDIESLVAATPCLKGRKRGKSLKFRNMN